MKDLPRGSKILAHRKVISRYQILREMQVLWMLLKKTCSYIITLTLDLLHRISIKLFIHLKLISKEKKDLCCGYRQSSGKLPNKLGLKMMVLYCEKTNILMEWMKWVNWFVDHLTQLF